MTPGLTAAPWPASTQPRGPLNRAQTTLSLSPTQEAPLSLGELLNWFSEVSKSWISSSGGPDPTAPRLHPPTKCCWRSIPTSFPSGRRPRTLHPLIRGRGDSHLAATLEQFMGAVVATALGAVMLEQGGEEGSRTETLAAWEKIELPSARHRLWAGSCLASGPPEAESWQWLSLEGLVWKTAACHPLPRNKGS